MTTPSKAKTTDVQKAPQVKTGTTLGALIARNSRAIQSVLPKHMDSNRMSRIALIEAKKNPVLMQCDPLTMIGSLIAASQLGLEPGVAGMGYLIPRKNKGKWEVQFMPGYRGLMEMARRSGKVGVLTADVVREKDSFSYQKGTSPFLNHIPSEGDRGKVTHVYAVGELIGGNAWQFEIMTLAQVEAIRSDHAAMKNGGPWATHWDEMAKKTVLRKLCKYLPMSIDIQRAVSMDEQLDAGISQGNQTEIPLDFDFDAPGEDMDVTPPTQ